MSHLVRLATAAALLSLASGAGLAQQAVPPGGAGGQPPGRPAATVTGRVTDQRSDQPIVGAQVYVDGTTVGTVTDAQGRFRLTGVRDGDVLIRAKMLGYAAAARTVAVRDGQGASVDFALAPAAVSLDAMVVTGTPGGTQLRAIGNAVERVDVAKAAELSPAVNVQQLLGQRSPGVMVLPNSGMVGTGSAVRIRGAASLSLANQPLIYVDGVRVDADPSAGPAIRQGRQAARLNDFNPEDIESMEIIKGPAAATLYGTEASNGVIQIITKKGKAGRPVLTVTAREGGTSSPTPRTACATPTA